MYVVAAEVVHDVARCLQQIVDALLLPQRRDVADEMLAAALQPRVGRQDLQAFETRPAAHDEHSFGRHAAAPDRDAAVGLVGRDRHVGAAKSPVLELQYQAMEEIAAAELRFVELGVEIVVIKNELLSEQLETCSNHKKHVAPIPSC